MQQKERFASSLSDDGRYRMLIEAVTDYAIYMLDADGRISSWNPGARRFKGYEESKSWASISRVFIPRRTANPACRNERLRSRRAKENSKARAGVAERTAPGSGPMS